MEVNERFEKLELLLVNKEESLKCPLIGTRVPAGFPSPAQDYIEDLLDLNEYLIAHPAATYFIRVEGNSMLNAGIHSGDILIVDRALEAANNKVVIAILDGELTVKRLMIDQHGDYFLLAENKDYKPIRINQNTQFSIWGVVTYVIHKV